VYTDEQSSFEGELTIENWGITKRQRTL